MRTLSIKSHKEKGFAMLEALVALLILTIGILGVAGMQMTAIQSGSVASQRTMVTIKTQELIERMMANPGLTTVTRTQVMGSNNANITTETVYDISTYVDAGVGKDNACNADTSCTPDQTAEYDIYLWRTTLNEVLPQDSSNGYPIYSVDVADNYIVTLDVTWIDRGNEYSYTVSTQIQPLVVEKSGS